MARYGYSDDRKRSPLSTLLRVIVELVIIVIGIYIAFQLEKNQDAKDTAALEKKYLEQLLEEAKLNQRELKADQDVRNVQLEYLYKLLSASNRQVDPDTLTQAIDYLVMIRLYSPTDAVYQDLVSSGNLGIIKSNAAKNILLRYRGALSRVPVTEGSDLKLLEDHIEPYLMDKQVLSLIQPHETYPQIALSDQQINGIIRVLLRDRKFLDLVYLRAHKIKDVIFFENPMQWHLRDLIKLLEEELAALEE